MSEPPARRRPALAFALIVAGTVLGIAGTDLVLPAVPGLPEALGGTPAAAQLVLAAFVAGSGVGLLLFGELGARFDQRSLLAASLLLYAGLSAAAAAAPSLDSLVALRLLQGAAGSAAAVFAPGMIRAMFDEARAVRAMGLFGSIESLVPALAPIIGVWLLSIGGWRLSFELIAVLSLLLAAALVALRRRLPKVAPVPHGGGYARLLRDPVFLRYALSQALSLGALLTFVFGAPAVIVGPMGGTLTDFIIVQVAGIAFFILGANLAGRLTARFGAERTILGGTALSAAGMLAMLGYALAGGGDPRLVALLAVPVNLGFGFRGPPGFYLAVLASRGDDSRGAALTILFILLTAAAGTAAAAPFITGGLAPLAAFAAAISAASVASLLLPRLEAQAGSSSAGTVSSIQPPPSTLDPS
ncbi:MAG TPA: MFS transporter [Allosphingosinicella sp.]|nr:MFS transporter [Allosphingosinicella sp.]